MPPGVPRLPDEVVAGGYAEAKAIEEAVKQGAETFKSLRNGDRYDQAAVAAGCSVMKAGLANTDTHDDVENDVYSSISSDFDPDGPYNPYIAGSVERVVTAITAANELPGGAARYYVQYCRL